MDLILEAKDANEWSYRGEGAANLVLSYNGTSSELVGKVIRVQKASNDGSIYENGHLAWSEHEQMMWKDAGSMVTAPTKDIAEQQFLQCVMIPLLGSEYVDAGRHILVSREFLEAVERNCLLLRPNWRVLASKVNMACDSVHLMSDLSVFPYSNSSEGPCICVEIKPKCGFLPSSRFISEKNAIKKKASRFKMHQALKLQMRQVLSQMKYFRLSGGRDHIFVFPSGAGAHLFKSWATYINRSIILTPEVQCMLLKYLNIKHILIQLPGAHLFKSWATYINREGERKFEAVNLNQ